MEYMHKYEGKTLNVLIVFQWFPVAFGKEHFDRVENLHCQYQLLSEMFESYKETRLLVSGQTLNVPTVF